MAEQTENKAAAGGFAPLKIPLFAVLWGATVLGNVGSFMRDVASSWLITDLSSNPSAVALMQTAATLPVFLLAIPAGVLSDILDRRRFLIFVQILLACVSGSLLVLSQTGSLTVEYLLALTFVGGIGAALMGPTWQAIVPELVPRAELKNAVALNSLGINIARSIGPAAGGLLLASFGAGAAYGADVMSYVLVIAALLWWKRPKAEDSGLSEHFFGAFRAGLRYARSSRELHVVLLRAAVFFAFSSSVWALLPLVARRMLGGSAGFYGVLLGAVGAGAILGAIVLPRLRQRLNADGLVLLAAVLTAVVMAALSLAPPQWLAVMLLLVLGAGWIIALTTLNGAAQGVLPNWVRGRGLAIYLMVFNGAMAAGSLLWGLVAQELGVAATLLVGGVGLLAAGLLFHRLSLPTGEADLQPSNHWPEPLVNTPVENDRGPVMIQVEYRIREQDRPQFLRTLLMLERARRRDGAYAWGITEHTGDPECIMEWFLVESWAEHLRQHQRVSHADADLQQEALRFHIGPEKPVVHHFLSLDRRQVKH
ncbi:MFS transporter [Serratia marcescens]|uniref:MFS transporter n=1 Tax=Serratia marcescens TaxID=615 RepID=UPI003204D878